MQDHATDVADAQPHHRCGLRIEIRESEHHAAHSDHRGVATPDEIRERLARMAIQRADRGVRRGCGLLPVAEAVDDRDERAFPDALD